MYGSGVMIIRVLGIARIFVTPLRYSLARPNRTRLFFSRLLLLCRLQRRPPPSPSLVMPVKERCCGTCRNLDGAILQDDGNDLSPA